MKILRLTTKVKERYSIMQNRNHHILANEIKNKKYIDNYIEKWLNQETLDRPYVECEICGYGSNASIHQHLLIPKEFSSNSNNNRIIHLCANCYYEHRALIDRHHFEMTPERAQRICEEAFEKLTDKKKQHREINQNLERIEV